MEGGEEDDDDEISVDGFGDSNGDADGEGKGGDESLDISCNFLLFIPLSSLGFMSSPNM